MFSGAFLRMFGKRFYKHGHVIVVYGVDYDRVWYHDPGAGIAACTASQHLDWHVFKNAWHPKKTNKGKGPTLLEVHALCARVIE